MYPHTFAAMIFWCTKIFLLGLLLRTLPFSALAEIYTLRKKYGEITEITCVASKQSETPLFLNPPFIALTNGQNEVDDWNWNKGNWFREQKDVSSYGPIVDKRWQDLPSFKTTDDNIGYFFLNDKPIPLSIYLKKSLTLRVISKEHRQGHIFTVNKLITGPKGRWFHLIIRREGNEIQIFSEEGETINIEKIDFNGPYKFYIETSTWYKLHESEYLWSNMPTNDQEENYINVSLSENLCITIYASVDKNCYLRFALQTNNNTTTDFFLGFNEKNELKKWNHKKICAASPGPARFFLNRETNVENQKDGYWAIKMEFSNRDTEIYHTNVPTSNSVDCRCEILHQTNITYDINPMVDTPGYLGNVSCETALGPSYRYCENHQICLDGHDCFCSWGHLGNPSCERKCDEGYHGLFCTKQCTNCTRCQPSTGACFENNEKSNTSSDIIVTEGDQKEKSNFPADITTSTSEEATLSSESQKDKSTTLNVTRGPEKDKVNVDDGDNVLHISSSANVMNPSTTTTSTNFTIPRTSTTAIGTIMWSLIGGVCAIIIATPILVWLLCLCKDLYLSISIENQTVWESTQRMLDPNNQHENV